MFFTHSSILTSLTAYTLPLPLFTHPFFFLFLVWFGFLYFVPYSVSTFSPWSTSSLFSVMLISFILLAFSSSFFLCIWLLEFATACCLYQFAPFEEKLDFLTRWVITFSPLFFPISPIECWFTSPCFLPIYIVFVTPLHLFWSNRWPPCWTVGVDFFAFTSKDSSIYY